MSLGAQLRNGEEILHALYISVKIMLSESNPVWPCLNEMNVYGINSHIYIVWMYIQTLA